MAAYRNQNTELEHAITRLELQKAIQLRELKKQLTLTYESVKPLNILKESLTDLKHMPEVKENLVETALSFAGGYFSKKLVMGKSNSLFKKIMGYALQYGVSKFISNKVHTKA
ncbi:hypothetical protein [Flavobacterium sp. 7A]|uniref:hypothetical protein n=1 Tax=Flavobacterium sp. 7A TaxID=2940571 RepID=UPI00222791D0|nr:hypothetical protein [Flavobacterium sp. 7A]MCW2119996.1 hypothetical protein [Flavobacterium sp. 7A]